MLESSLIAFLSLRFIPFSHSYPLHRLICAVIIYVLSHLWNAQVEGKSHEVESFERLRMLQRVYYEVAHEFECN